MPDITINLFTITFGTLIFGLGYIGLIIRYIFWNKDFYNLKIFDKIVQSFILGTISFIFTMQGGFLSIANLSTEQEMLNYILLHPIIFIYQFFYVIMFSYLLIVLELIVKILLGKIKKNST
jgi:hypothetical protein